MQQERTRKIGIISIIGEPDSLRDHQLNQNQSGCLVTCHFIDSEDESNEEEEELDKCLSGSRRVGWRTPLVLDEAALDQPNSEENLARSIQAMFPSRRKIYFKKALINKLQHIGVNVMITLSDFC